MEPSSFTAWVIAPVRQRWLSWWRYSRNWESVCTLHGLTARLGDRTLVPALRVGADRRSRRRADPAGGGRPVDHRLAQTRSEALAAAWRAERLTIRATAPGELRIIISRGDVLAEPIQPAHADAGNHGRPGRGAGRDHRNPDLVAAARFWDSTSW